jgi:hypothetical protein
MYCTRCIVATHARHPTHFVEVRVVFVPAIYGADDEIQRWNGKNFVRKRTWLRELGLRVQLNHPPGVVCPYRFAAASDFVLYDTTGVHEISVDFCGCIPREGARVPLEPRVQLLRAGWWPATVIMPTTCATFAVLKLFQILNCLGKLSAYDFLRGLEMCTNHDGLDKPPVRAVFATVV